PVAVERVFLDDLDGVLREELAHLAQPRHERELRFVERARRDFLAHAAALVLASVEVLERLVAAPVLALHASGHAPLGVLAEHEPPAREHAHGLPQAPRPSASSTSSSV